MKHFVFIIVASMSFLLSSCGFMEGMMSGMAGFMGNGSYYPAAGMYGSSVPASWGNGYAGPMTYSSDPIVNSTIGMAQTEARLASQGVNVSSSNNSGNSSRSTSSSSSNGSGWYQCCSSTPNFGITSYHKCPNCGQNHQIGSGHLCKKK